MAGTPVQGAGFFGDYSALMHGSAPLQMPTQASFAPPAAGYGYADTYGYAGGGFGPAPSYGLGYAATPGFGQGAGSAYAAPPAWGTAWQAPPAAAEAPRARHHRGRHRRRASISSDGSGAAEERVVHSPVRRPTRPLEGTPGGSLDASQELRDDTGGMQAFEFSDGLEGAEVEVSPGVAAGAGVVPVAKSAPAPTSLHSCRNSLTDLLVVSEDPGEQVEQLVKALTLLPSLSRIVGPETLRVFANGLVQVGVAGFAGVGSFRGTALCDVLTDNLAIVPDAAVLQAHPQRALVFGGLDRLYAQACKLVTDEVEAACASPPPCPGLRYVRSYAGWHPSGCPGHARGHGACLT